MHDRWRKIWRKKEGRAEGGDKIEFNILIYINLVKILIMV
jgi:hypothetical protein